MWTMNGNMSPGSTHLNQAAPLEQSFPYHLLPTIALIFLLPTIAAAQDVGTNITSSGLNTQVDQVGNSFTISGGTRPGSGVNLFHSFGNFSVGGGDLANFLNNTGLPTSNILGRVTGGNISNIYGTIQTTGYGSANLILMNPSGIVLGPGASLNLGGSVSFTTAQYIRLFDGVGSAQFYANPANDGLANSILTINASAFEFLSAAPAGYGFLTAPDPNATITVRGSTLSVPSGRAISLVGGKVVIEGGAQLSAPNGTINLASAVSPGEFDVTTLGSLPNVDGAASASVGSVSLAPGSSIDVHGASTVWIKGGQLVLSMNNATLSTSENPVPPDAISLSPGSSIVTSNSGTDPGADLHITVGHLKLDGSTVRTETLGAGTGGNLVAKADSMTLDNLAQMTTQTSGIGRGGNLSMTADRMQMSNGSEVRTESSFGGGVGGDVSLSVRELVLNSGSVIKSFDFNFGIDIDGDFLADAVSSGSGGHVTVQGVQGLGSTVESVTLRDGSQIVSESLDGNGGRLAVAATSLNLYGASTIKSSTFGLGRGGDIELNIRNAGLFEGSTISSNTVSTPPPGMGLGGTITVQGLSGGGSLANTVRLTDFRSGIMTDSFGNAPPGDIVIHAKAVSLTNGAVIEGGTRLSEATGGNIIVDSESISITGGSRVSSQARAQDAGRITMTTSDLLLDDGSIDTTSISEIGKRGGDVVLTVGAVTLRNGSAISASSTGNGNAGNITINSSSTVLIQDSAVTTEASHASGGQITINAPQMVRLINSPVSTSVAGAAGDSNGGNIRIDPQFVILQGSQILAQAFAGSGGAIDVTAGLFLADPSSLVDATSTLGVSGTVQINAAINNLSSVVAQLPESLLAVHTLLRAACAARLAQGATSSFVERGRDGIPAGPDGLLASPYLPMTSGHSAQPHATPSTGVFGIQLRRLFGTEMPSSVTLFSDHAACSS